MIKVGIRLSEHVTPELFRLLSKHPDVEVCFIAKDSDEHEYEKHFFHTLQGEVTDIPVVSAIDKTMFDDIDLYIGPSTSEFEDYFNESEIIKAIYTSGAKTDIVAVCEFNRKAMVRGGRKVWHPDVETLLGALALMPLAKNLMLNGPVTGTTMVASDDYGRVSYRIVKGPDKDGLRVLREEILASLQTSFSAPLEMNCIETTGTAFSCGIFTVDVKLSAEQATELYKEFYSDHRHVSFPDKDVSDTMVMGTNKAALRLWNDNMGRLVVSVAVDERYKGGAGNIVHALNLLFGLDERTGL